MRERNAKSYWVVSPNVKDDDDDLSVAEWKRASILGHAAFMGYLPNDRKSGRGAGYKFAHKISPDDVILIARRHRKEPDLVGFGVVQGKFGTHLTKAEPPRRFGSYRKLEPFVSLVGIAPKVPIESAIGQTSALARLHRSRPDHERICAWIDKQMAKAGGGRANNVFTPTEGNGARPTSAKENPQLDYLFRTRSQVTRARRREERLMQCYRDWLSKKHRALQIMVYAGRFRCDGYDVVRRNLIEAKSSANREYIRMAVGQLLDYSYLSKEAGYKPPHLAILLPERPLKQIETWLASHAIGIIFPAKGAFVDNARGQFV